MGPNENGKATEKILNELKEQITDGFQKVENDFQSVNKNINDLTTSIKGDAYGNEGLVNRVQKLEEFKLEHVKKDAKWRGIIVGVFGMVSVIEALIIIYLSYSQSHPSI